MNAQPLARTSFQRYVDASERAAAQIITAYSTSFGAATQLLGHRHRAHVKNIYALVRVADELVDGVAAEAHLTPQQQLESLDALEAETHLAILRGYSSNPIVQAFANSARLAEIDDSLTAPFFSSMRMDLRTLPTTGSSSFAPHRDVIGFDDASHAEYVYGSAEVVGLMCLRVFIRDEHYSTSELQTMEQGAQSLGAAFQNINFMRDLADDTQRLARSYLSDGRLIDEALKLEWIHTIRTQLTRAHAALPLLPRDARTGVGCAYRLFSQLTDKLANTPAEQLLRQRVRVSNPNKALILAQSIIATRGTTSTQHVAATRKTRAT